MAKKNVSKQDEQLESVNEALSRSERWIEENQKMLTIVVSVIVVVVFAVIAINQWVIKPNALAASNENASAEVYFQRAEQAALQGDSTAADLYKKALEGDDADCVGFLEVADNYSNQQAKLAALYAGICYAELGQYDDAVEYLEKFSAKDVTIAPAAAMRLGDVYVELGELEKAAKSFEQAAEAENEIVAPIAMGKAARVYLKLEDKASAKRVLETLKKQYPGSQDAQEADKYLPLCAE